MTYWKTCLVATVAGIVFATGAGTGLVGMVAILMKHYPILTFMGFLFVLYLCIRNHIKKPRTRGDSILGSVGLLVAVLLYLQFSLVVSYGALSSIQEYRPPLHIGSRCFGLPHEGSRGNWTSPPSCRYLTKDAK